MSKGRIFLVIAISLIAVAIPTVLIILICKFGIDSTQSNIAELISYSATTLSGITALYVVVIALFGQVFKDYLYAEEMSVSMDENTVKEIFFSNEEENIVVDKYYAELQIKNIGVSTIKNCKLKINDIQYKSEDNKRYISIFNPTFDCNVVKHPNENEVNNIIRGHVISWPIIYIHSPKSSGQPNETQMRTSQENLEIIGVKLKEQNNKKGTWLIKYSIQVADKKLKDFEVELYWGGNWEKRATEMNNAISIKIK